MSTKHPNRRKVASVTAAPKRRKTVFFHVPFAYRHQLPKLSRSVVEFWNRHAREATRGVTFLGLTSYQRQYDDASSVLECAVFKLGTYYYLQLNIDNGRILESYGDWDGPGAEFRARFDEAEHD